MIFWSSAGTGLGFGDRQDAVERAVVDAEVVEVKDDVLEVIQRRAIRTVALEDQFGGLAPERAAKLVLQGHGAYGSSLDYLRNVVRHLDDFGIDDGPLHRVLAIAEATAGAG